MTEEATAPEAAPEGTIPPETPASETAAEGEQPTPTETETTTETEEEGAAVPAREPWYQRRIDEITRARREAERERDALRAMVEGGQQQETTQPIQSPQQDPYELAKQIASQERLAEACNKTYAAGKQAHPDFDVAVSQLSQVNDRSQSPEFLETVTALPNAEDVYYHLGKNPDEAAHILSLSPARMALELARVSAEVGRPKKSSNAPPPASTSVTGSAVPSSELSDDLPIDEWIKRRNEEVKKRRG